MMWNIQGTLLILLLLSGLTVEQSPDDIVAAIYNHANECKDPSDGGVWAPQTQCGGSSCNYPQQWCSAKSSGGGSPTFNCVSLPPACQKAIQEGSSSSPQSTTKPTTKPTTKATTATTQAQTSAQTPPPTPPPPGQPAAPGQAPSNATSGAAGGAGTGAAVPQLRGAAALNSPLGIAALYPYWRKNLHAGLGGGRSAEGMPPVFANNNGGGGCGQQCGCKKQCGRKRRAAFFRRLSSLLKRKDL